MTDIDKIQPDLPHVVIGPVISSGSVVVNKCETCPHATWDYDECFGGQRDYFVDGCAKKLEPEECGEDE